MEAFKLFDEFCTKVIDWLKATDPDKQNNQGTEEPETTAGSKAGNGKENEEEPETEDEELDEEDEIP